MEKLIRIQDVLAGVPVEISATVIMQTLFGFDLDNYYRYVLIHMLTTQVESKPSLLLRSMPLTDAIYFRDVLVLFAFIAGFAILLVATVVYVLRERR